MPEKTAEEIRKASLNFAEGPKSWRAPSCLPAMRFFPWTLMVSIRTRNLQEELAHKEAKEKRDEHEDHEHKEGPCDPVGGAIKHAVDATVDFVGKVSFRSCLLVPPATAWDVSGRPDSSGSYLCIVTA